VTDEVNELYSVVMCGKGTYRAINANFSSRCVEICRCIRHAELWLCFSVEATAGDS
jgi:hypothetical protein